MFAPRILGYLPGRDGKRGLNPISLFLGPPNPPQTARFFAAARNLAVYLCRNNNKDTYIISEVKLNFMPTRIDADKKCACLLCDK